MLKSWFIFSLIWENFVLMVQYPGRFLFESGCETPWWWILKFLFNIPAVVASFCLFSLPPLSLWGSSSCEKQRDVETSLLHSVQKVTGLQNASLHIYLFLLICQKIKGVEALTQFGLELESSRVIKVDFCVFTFKIIKKSMQNTLRGI